MKGFKDSNKKFHPISQIKGVRSRRDKSLKPDGVRLQRDSPFLVKGKIDDKKLKNFWEDLSSDERHFAVQKSTWENLNKKDKLNLIKFEKNVTQVRPEVKSELVRRGISTVPSLEKVSEEKAEKLLKDYDESQREDKREFARIKDLVEEHFNFDKIKNLMKDQEIISSSVQKNRFVRFVITGKDYDILNHNPPKNATQREQLEDETEQLVDFLTANLRSKLGKLWYAFRDKDGDIVVAQRLDPKLEEDNAILISKGILRRKRD